MPVIHLTTGIYSHTPHKEEQQEKRKKMCFTHSVSAGFYPSAEPQLTSWPQVYCMCSWSVGHSFALFPDVSVAWGRKLKQALWSSPYFTCRAEEKGKLKKCTSAPRLLDARQNFSPFFLLEKESTTHFCLSSQRVPVALPIVNSLLCIVSSAFWNHANLCQTFRDLNHRRHFLLCCFLPLVLSITHLYNVNIATQCSDMQNALTNVPGWSVGPELHLAYNVPS